MTDVSRGGSLPECSGDLEPDVPPVNCIPDHRGRRLSDHSTDFLGLKPVGRV